MKVTILTVVLTVLGGMFSSEARAQYAIGHRSFGGGTAVGAGLSKMDLDFTDVDDSKLAYLLPSLELKLFLSDKLSIDLSVPVTNIAASNALRDYFFVSGEAYVNFHPSAPSALELFVAPGIGFSYAFDEYEDGAGATVQEDAWAFHVPVRVGIEINNARRNFSFFAAARPFFNLVHGAKGDINPGGGMLLEIGVMAYSVGYRGDRY
jgi:hypothetical protein